MTALLLIALIVVAIVLWQRIDVLERRLAMVELLNSFEPDFAVPSAAPAPFASPELNEAGREPAPRPSPPTAPIPALAPAPVTVVEPEPAAEPRPEPAAPSRRFGFEDIFGRYLPIWAGGITLAVAGFLIVKYSIDLGLLSPAVRVIAGMLFGSALIAGAEVALRSDDIARDPRIRQALSGAGIATLYASILVAANVYSLIGAMTAFVGLAGVTMLAGLLSLRFGAPSAVLGLVGGLAAPALVGSTDPDVPLLSTYLALTVGGLSVLGRAQRWWWLGALAVAGGFGWGLLLIASGLHDTASLLSVGTLTLLLAVGLPLLIFGDAGRIFRLGAAIAGCAQMAAIVALGGFAPLHWALYGLISVALVWLSRREKLLADVPLAGLGIGAMLTIAWHPAPAAMLTTVLAIGALIYGAPALWRLWRPGTRLSDAVQIAVIAAGVALIPVAHFAWTTPRADFAPLALLGTAIAGAAAAFGWRNPARHDDARFAVLSVSAILLGLLAAGLVLPVWALAPAAAGAAVAALLLGEAADDPLVSHAGLLILFGGVVGLVMFDPNELLRAIGFVATTLPGQAATRWALGALAALLFACRAGPKPLRDGTSGLAVLLFYVALAQLISPYWLPLAPAAMLAALATAGERAPIPALIAAGGLAIAWTLQPFWVWVLGTSVSLVGMPVYLTALPHPGEIAIHILAPTLALAAMMWRRPLPHGLRQAGTVAVIILATIAAHVAWKQVFAIADWPHFVAYAMAERTSWEALLLGAALVTWHLGARGTAIGLGVAGLTHFTWFTALMLNPLWSEQAAGIWLAPAYALAFALIWLSRFILSDATWGRIRDGVRMPLILLLAASLLRQTFHGSMLSEPGMTQAEDIARSLLAIALAICFLQWGIRRALRDWRIVSLVLMLGAVGKVFLFDAAGLDGLMRIGSFAALGFSLIGVGWLYSRYLPDASLTDESHSADTAAATHGGN